jgi:transposase-like protein
VKIHSTNPIEPLSGEIKTRLKVVGMVPVEAAILLEQKDGWAVPRSR